MTRLTITIRKEGDRERAHDLVRASAFGSRIEFKQEKRSTDQNSKMWASLADVAEQVKWHGVHMEAEDWKLVFLDALKREVRMVPNIDGNGFVALGRSSSDLSVSEMSDLIELILMFGANHGVTFNEPILDSSGGDSSKAHAHAETDTPVASGPHAAVAAGVREEASTLSDDWRQVVIQNLAGHRDRPASLAHRYSDAMQMIGGQPNAWESAWIGLAWSLVAKRNRGEISRGEFDTEIDRLKSMPPAVAGVAA